jgi:hypothetical protein
MIVVDWTTVSIDTLVWEAASSGCDGWCSVPTAVPALSPRAGSATHSSAERVRITSKGVANIFVEWI